MIKEITMYYVACDRCGKSSCDGTDYAAWADRDGAIETARDADWHITDDDKHYCWDCMEYDEETDEYRPKEKEQVKA